MTAWLISRRVFLRHAASAAASVSVLTVTTAAGTSKGANASARMVAHTPAAAVRTTEASVQALDPVVSFHMDQPYLDITGLAVPYHPPAGTRSGQPLAELSAENFHALFC